MRVLPITVVLSLLIVESLRTQDSARPRATHGPNIVVLFADDAGYADFGFQEHPDPKVGKLTPHIDRIAHEGVRFTDAYVSGCVCSPSRAGLMTGRYQQRFGHERNLPQRYMKGGMSLQEHTVADRLGELGLQTALIGKWHLGYPEAYHPNRRGFADFTGLLMGSRPYVPLPNPDADRVIQHNGEALPESGYVTDRFGGFAVDWIEKHKDEPFFLFVSFTAVHGPLQPLDEDLETLDGFAQQRRRNYAGLMVGLDRAVGRVLDALDRNHLTDNTLVVFTNDNGGQTLTGAVNRPLRGRKGQLWEGGIRVPMAMRWPGHITPGLTIRDPVITLDLLPTFVAVQGGRVDPLWKLDGVDLLPRITGKLDRLPERTLFWRSQGSKGPIAARRGDLKLLVGRSAEASSDENAAEAAQPQLFDLAHDIGETTDVAAQHLDKLASILTETIAWESELIEPLWGGD